MAHKEPTISSILRELAEEFDDVVAEREVFDRVLARRPSSAKNPYASVRQQVRYEGPRLGWVPLGEGKLIPLRVVLQGLRFRLIPDEAEIRDGALVWASLRPFVPAAAVGVRFVDAAGTPIPTREVTVRVGEGPFGVVTAPAISLGDWFARIEMQLGDSVLVTIDSAEPLTLRLDREAAAAFRADDVAEQERELVEALAGMVTKGQRGPVMAQMTILPIYARASWRTGYPGRPWQLLVEQDRRMRLIHSEMITDVRSRSTFDMFGDDTYDENDKELEEELFRQISALQEDLRLSRRSAVERGLWDGMAPRVSTAQTLFDFEQGTSTTIYPGAVNALEDHSAAIEEHIANGDYEDDGWDGEGDIDMDLDMDDDADGLGELTDIDDVQAFVERNPEIAEATRRLMESLSPEEQQRLDEATSIEDVQQVLAPRLPGLLRSEPSLFVPLEPSMYEYHTSDGDGHANGNGNGNGHANGNGHGIEPDLLSNDGWVDDDESIGGDEEWQDEDLLGENDDDEAFDGAADEIEAALERSSALLDQFVEIQVQSGKSKATATGRASDLWLYADFLSRYYGRGLDQGDYATLDECLFFYYPRKVLNSSPRNAREICTSAKQFYAFLKAEREIADDAFAVAIWQRRDQAARVVELYDQIDGDSPQFERLFAHLFAPYTA